MRAAGISLMLTLSLLAGVSLNAQRCTQTQNQQAETESDQLRSWSALYRSFERYGKCDNVSAAEGYSESVARILVDHWDTLRQGAAFMNQNGRFKRFVFAGINSTLAAEDVRKIGDNARKNCPRELSALCTELLTASKSAIEDMAPQQR